MTPILTLLKSKFIPWLLLIGCLYIGYLHIQQLKAENQLLKNSTITLQEDKQQLIEIIDYKNNKLLDLSDQYSQNQQQLIEQKQQLQDINALNRQSQQQLERLENENEQLRLWSNSNLPDDIKRLYTRPEIKGSNSYRQWLSKRNSMLSTDEQPKQ